MEFISVTFMSPNGTRNGLFGAIATNKVHEKTRETCQKEPHENFKKQRRTGPQADPALVAQALFMSWARYGPCP